MAASVVEEFFGDPYVNKASQKLLHHVMNQDHNAIRDAIDEMCGAGVGSAPLYFQPAVLVKPNDWNNSFYTLARDRQPEGTLREYVILSPIEAARWLFDAEVIQFFSESIASALKLGVSDNRLKVFMEQSLILNQKTLLRIKTFPEQNIASFREQIRRAFTEFDKKALRSITIEANIYLPMWDISRPSEKPALQGTPFWAFLPIHFFRGLNNDALGKYSGAVAANIASARNFIQQIVQAYTVIAYYRVRQALNVTGMSAKDRISNRYFTMPMAGWEYYYTDPQSKVTFAPDGSSSAQTEKMRRVRLEGLPGVYFQDSQFRIFDERGNLINQEIVPDGFSEDSVSNEPFHEKDGWSHYEHIEGSFKDAFKAKLKSFGGAVKRGTIHVAKGKQGTNSKYFYILFVNKSGENGDVPITDRISVNVSGDKINIPVGKKLRQVTYPALMILDGGKLHIVASTVKRARGESFTSYHLSPVAGSRKSYNFINKFMKDTQQVLRPSQSWPDYLIKEFERVFPEKNRGIRSQITHHTTLEQL